MKNWITDLFSEEDLSLIGVSLEQKEGDPSIVSFLDTDPFFFLYFLNGTIGDTSKGFFVSMKDFQKLSLSELEKKCTSTEEENVLIQERLKNGQRPFLQFSNEKGLLHLGEMCIRKKEYIEGRMRKPFKKSHGRAWTYKGSGCTVRSQ